jgi:acyl carrier protein
MNRLKKVLTQVLGIDPKDITNATSPETVETWDSFNGLMLVSELEKEFSVSFTMDEVILVKNVGDIIAALQRHGVRLED